MDPFEESRECPVAHHLSAADRAMGCGIVLQLLDADTHNCEELDMVADRLRCETLITSFRLRTIHETSDINHLFPCPVTEHIFKLSYPSTRRPYMQPLRVSVSGFFASRPHDLTVVLHPAPRKYANDVEKLSYEESVDLEAILEGLAEQAGYEFCKVVYIVATDTWPPQGPSELLRKTPEISEAAFAAAVKSCRERGVENMNCIEVISWSDARHSYGSTACDLLASEPSPLRLSQDNACPWVPVSWPAVPEAD